MIGQDHPDDWDDPLAAPDDWAPADLGTLWDDNQTIERPTVLPVQGGGGAGLFYPARTNALYGESGAGKTWIGLLALLGPIAAGRPVVVIDFEDTAPLFVRRLKLLGCPRERLPQIRYVQQPGSPLTEQRWRALLNPAPACLLLDGVTGFYAVHGLDIDSADSAERFAGWMRGASDTGACVLTIDQTGKGRDGKAFALGSQHKRSAISGAAYRVDAITAFSAYGGGEVSLTVTKDRPGGLPARQNTEAARVRMTPDHHAGRLNMRVQPGEGWQR